MVNKNIREVIVEYKKEKYKVREDGQVLRFPKNEAKPRPLDNKWTYGSRIDKNNYSYIGSERINRIVCTAFHGEPPTKQHIADHIDTNRQNNRKENLRWVTKLENALNNPITRKKIELICGSIDNFIENPSCLRDSTIDPNFSWMRRVTPEEAKISKERLLEWAKSDNVPSGGTIGEWIFESNEPQAILRADKESKYTKSINDNALQLDWKTPTQFLKCPKKVYEKGLEEYFNNLITWDIFSINDYGNNNVLHKELSLDNNYLFVITDLDNPIKSFALAKIYIKDDHYIHESMGMFFEERGAHKLIREEQGLEWDGEDGIDDYA